LLEPDAWKAGTSGSEGAGAQQCPPATRRFRIQRQTKQGSHHRYVYTWVAKRSLNAIMTKVKTITRQGTNNPLHDLLRQLNPMLRGWTNYFRHAVAKQTFSYLQAYTWRRVIGWLRRKYHRANWKQIRRHIGGGWWPLDEGTALFDTRTVPVTRYRYRGAAIATPWSQQRVPGLSS